MSGILEHYGVKKKSLQNQKLPPTPLWLAVKIAFWALVWGSAGAYLLRMFL